MEDYEYDYSLGKVDDRPEEEKERLRRETEKAAKELKESLKSRYRIREIVSVIIGLFFSSIEFRTAFAGGDMLSVVSGLVFGVLMFLMWAGFLWGWENVAGKIPFIDVFLIGFFIQIIIALFVGWFFLLKYLFVDRKKIFCKD